MTYVHTDTPHISKSELSAWEICPTKAWCAIHYKTPAIPSEKMTFGSCVDAGCGLAITYVRSGQEPDYERMLEAARSAQQRDQIDVDFDEIDTALRAFVKDVIPLYDWSHAQVQHRIAVNLFDWGEVVGYLDMLLPEIVLDGKTSTKSKSTARTIELGLYGIMVEATGKPIKTVGYATWVRKKTPEWQILTTPLTDTFRDWTRERVSGYIRSKRADALLNKGVEVPQNWTFTSGPVNGSMCFDCQYSPLFGGPCNIAVIEETNGTGTETPQ